MIIKKYFEYEKEIDLTVANIGVSKWNWNYTSEESTKDEAQKIKKENNFDVLPIRNAADEYDYYWGNEELGDYSNILKKKIEEANTIYYRTSIRDAIKKFVDDDVSHYFLTNHDGIVGLISWVNFNCLYVYNYLYNEIAELEMVLSNYISEIISEEQVLEILKNSSDVEAKRVYDSYNNLKITNSENSIFQHLYLKFFHNIIKNIDKEILRHRSSLKDYSKLLCSDLTNLRNNVAHPVRPIISGAGSFKELKERLEIIDRIKQIIKS